MSGLHEKLEGARKCAAFEGVSEVMLQDLASLLLPLDLPAGGVLFAEGDEGDAMYVVVDGDLEVSRRGRSVASVGEGALLGDMALLTEAPRAATAKARHDSKLLRMSRDGFIELLESEHPAAFALLRNLARIQCERVLRLDDELQRRGEPDVTVAMYAPRKRRDDA